MLSDKAKGKLRAVDAPESSESPPRELVVRFTEGEQDLVLSVTEKDAVRDVKRMVWTTMTIQQLFVKIA
jgi:hypothetical protein